MAKQYAVRAVHCDHRASDEGIYDKICAVTDPLERSWARLEHARNVVIKVNLYWPEDKIRRFAGRCQELVDESVFRAVLRRLRERTSAHLMAVDTNWLGSVPPEGPPNYAGILREFGVEYVDGSEASIAYDVPGGGHIFTRYMLSPCFAKADAAVSVATLKTHLFQGVTLTLKNLFGLTPISPDTRPRTYFHHFIRLSYVLPDLGRIVQPCLNIVDGLVGQSGKEFDGNACVCDVLLAGDHTIATDACGAWLMGHDPASDWPVSPFLRDRNPLLIAAENGFGTVNLDEIDLKSDVQRPVGDFAPDLLDPPATMASWRRTCCEQALFYREHAREFLDRYAGEYILLHDGQVIAHGTDLRSLPSRRVLSGEKKDSAIFIKFVDPGEWEGEHFEVYERELACMHRADA